VHKTFQKEELVVLRENINKAGGSAVFVPHIGDVPTQLVDIMRKIDDL